jgi:hypothetical protein
MNAQRYYPAILGGCLATFGACAFAQAPTTDAAVPATGTSAAATSESHPAATSPTPAKAHHATKHRATRAVRASEPNISSDEAQYRMALRQCVEAQASQRDQCLDNAISRYGKS